MKHFAIAALLVLAACSKTQDGKVYGSAPTLTQAVNVSQILNQPANYDSKEILVSGVIKDVCQEKGCWLSLESEGKTVMVRFKDYAFFVPKDAGGQPVTIQGVFHADMKKQMHPDGDNCAETCKENSRKSYSMIASGVVIKS